MPFPGSLEFPAVTSSANRFSRASTIEKERTESNRNKPDRTVPCRTVPALITQLCAPPGGPPGARVPQPFHLQVCRGRHGEGGPSHGPLHGVLRQVRDRHV